MTSIDDIATNLQIFYQKILDIFQSESSPIDKWKSIASYIHENNDIVTKSYKKLKKKLKI